MVFKLWIRSPTEGTKFCSNCGTAVSDTGNTITVNPAVTDLPAKPKKKTGRSNHFITDFGSDTILINFRYYGKS